MSTLKKYEFWFLTGSQDLYGAEALANVEADSKAMIEAMNATGKFPCKLVNKGLGDSPDGITKVMKEANYDDSCAGVIIWAHTFTPSKMWITGLVELNKPLLHLHTQYNRDIPFESIDMDFMNLNQSAHGDRELAFMATRLRMNRKVVVGHYEDEKVVDKISGWMRAAVGVAYGKTLRVCRFGDNMREVGVTEGDKVETQIKLGWQVNTFPVGDLVDYMNAVTDAEIKAKMDEYAECYDMNTDDIASVEYQAREEIAMEKYFKEGGFGAFTNTFQDLYGMKQLPGLATQNLMKKGIGYGGEGDWKIAALDSVMKVMAEGLPGGTAFMEDYTYHMEPGNELILGAHMLEVDPVVASDKPKIEVHHLGIGDREPPARLVFSGKAGTGITCCLIDMGGRMRLICADVEAVEPIADMPKLPVAKQMWKPLPDLLTSAEAWMYAGGAHHTVLSFDLTAENMRDWAEMNDIEFVHINKDIKMEDFKRDLFLMDIAYKLK